MSDFSNLEVGQIVFVLPINNAARGNKNVQLSEAKVSRVGKKYFYLEHGEKSYLDKTPYQKENGYQKANGCSNYCVYLNSVDYNNEKSVGKWRSKLRSEIQYGCNDFTFEQWAKVAEILNLGD